MTDRRGFFKYLRDPIEAIEEAYGAVAVQIFLRLLTNARITTGIVRIGGIEVVMLRGTALFSGDTFANALDRSRSAVYRAFDRLVAAGEIAVVEKGRRLKHGRGSVGTIVKITNFERYNFSTAEARVHFGTRTETLERTREEKASAREELVKGVMENELGEDEVAEAKAREMAEMVLDYFTVYVNRDGDRDAALEEIARLVELDVTSDALMEAAGNYADDCARRGVDRMPAEAFYRGRIYERFATRTNGERK